jgi:indolepyruvate ferredoxin oxidoreductase beta subunit
MEKNVGIILSGVGGQGVITAAKILGKAAIVANMPVYISEVHGMAQRGGSVICTVRMGKASGALLARGMANAIISIEPMEALRYIRFANKKTKVVTDINPVVPFNVTVSGEKYPKLEDVFNEIESKAELYKVNALEIARKAGAIITKNIVMLGSLSAIDVLPFETKILLDTIIESIPERYININKKAFQGGIDAIKIN